MEYTLRKITKKDRDFIYNLKKESNFKYVEKIWGWDRAFKLYTALGFDKINSTKTHYLLEYK